MNLFVDKEWERAKKYEKIKTKFQGKNPFVIQWDGKLMHDLTGKDKVDRLPMLVWISAPQASCAPYNDLLLMKSLLEYSSLHSDISMSTSHKFGNHLWYLSYELVSLAFFDSRVSVSTQKTDGECEADTSSR
ncbi:hypothetical protein JTE90_016298 [Oedothorax gibbosus]|uniref:Uncharacterized protein n=1 Tax=Oedothorax gibbosus TaxID=931172 RepID=A0AAV6TNG8_9ARAC|nr:hypothetical protein JTE90_016298 [Oedothorax gibbosus]